MFANGRCNKRFNALLHNVVIFKTYGYENNSKAQKHRNYCL